MADFLSLKDRSLLMSRIKSSANESTELRTVQALRSAGLSGWRRRVALPGKPDFVWHREKVALFVDGCFWHGCPRHGHVPHSRKAYWVPKLIRNKTRDELVAGRLRKLGWSVLRVWECSLGTEEETQRFISRLAGALQRIVCRMQINP